MNTRSYENEHFPGSRATDIARGTELFVLVVITLSVLGFIFLAAV